MFCANSFVSGANSPYDGRNKQNKGDDDSDPGWWEKHDELFFFAVSDPDGEFVNAERVLKCINIDGPCNARK